MTLQFLQGRVLVARDNVERNFFPGLLWAINGARLDPEGKEVVFTQDEFERLPDYSCSLPTGKTIGKQWRRRVPYNTGPGIVNRWYLGEYAECEPPELGMVFVKFTPIRIARDVREDPFVGYR